MAMSESKQLKLEQYLQYELFEKGSSPRTFYVAEQISPWSLRVSCQISSESPHFRSSWIETARTNLQNSEVQKQFWWYMRIEKGFQLIVTSFGNGFIPCSTASYTLFINSATHDGWKGWSEIEIGIQMAIAAEKQTKFGVQQLQTKHGTFEIA